jgi:hypothetical protein
MKHLEDNRSALAGKTRPSRPDPARADDAYRGTYSSSYYGPATVERKSGRLVLTLGARRMTFVLTHWSGDVFSYVPRGENALGISAATFNVGATGTRAQTLTLENLNADKLGTFTRETR